MKEIIRKLLTHGYGIYSIDYTKEFPTLDYGIYSNDYTKKFPVFQRKFQKKFLGH